MTTPDQDQLGEAIAVARELAAQFGRVVDRLEEVNSDSEKRDEALAKRNKMTFRLVLGTIGGFAFDIAISIIVTVLAVIALHASSTANETRVSSLSSCQASNVTRASEVALWEHLAAVTEGPKTKPAQRKAVAALIAYVKHIFAPRDCQVLYGPHPRKAPQPPQIHR